MRGSRSLGAAFAATAVLASAGPAMAGPVAGARYDGAGGTPATRQFLTVAKDGSRLARYAFTADGTCSDGKPYAADPNEVREPAAPIAADGTFTKPSKSFTGTIRRGGKRIRATSSGTLAGSFSADGAQVTVSTTVTLRAKGLRCRATGQITLNRDGTPAAPFVNESVSTGTYVNGLGTRVDVRPFRVLAPAGELRNFTLRYVARCSRGGTFKNSFKAPLFVLDLRNRLSVTDSFGGKVRGGLRYRARDRLTLRFSKRNGQFQYEGTYRLRLVITRSGRTVDRCRVPTDSFRGVGLI